MSSQIIPYREAVRRVLRNAGNRAGNQFGHRIAQATGFRGLGSLTQTTTRRRRTIEPAANTNQHDLRGRYRYKRMPARKRKAWKRFTRRVQHVDLQMQPLQVYTKEGVSNQTSVANANGAFSRICGGTTVTAPRANDELFQCFNQAYNLGGVIANAVPYKLYIKSMCMDVEVANNGSYPVIIDMYTLKCRSKFASATDPATQLAQAWGELAALPGGGVVTTSATALTVFDAPNFCSYWKVLRKQEIIIGSGQVATFQMRIPMNRHIEGKDLQSSMQALPGYSRCFLFTWHGSPSNRGAAGAAQFDSVSLTFGYQHVVHYAVPPSSTTKEAGATS